MKSMKKFSLLMINVADFKILVGATLEALTVSPKKSRNVHLVCASFLYTSMYPQFVHFMYP